MESLLHGWLDSVIFIFLLIWTLPEICLTRLSGFFCPVISHHKLLHFYSQVVFFPMPRVLLVQLLVLLLLIEWSVFALSLTNR